MNNNFLDTRYIKTKSKLRKVYTYKEEFPSVKKEHEEIASFINEYFLPSVFTKAYIKHKSIYHNVAAHMYNDLFIKLDIKDFFNSINHNLLTEALYYEMNKQHKNTINKVECRKLVSTCSVSNKGIPLGLITSPILSNVYLKQFDNILYGKLKKMSLINIIYTRYADDLVISFKSSISHEKIIIQEIIKLVISLLSKFKLKLNTSKTRIVDFSKSNHVKITGVNIIKTTENYRKLSVGRQLKNNLFHDSIRCFENCNKNQYEVLRVKGLESFILSIEKRNYEEVFSPNMRKKISELGFSSLHELIRNL